MYIYAEAKKNNMNILMNFCTAPAKVVKWG